MSKPGRCDTCAHDGCCEHYCGGAYWSDAYGDDHVFCCLECYDNWAAENDIDDEGA